MTIIAHKTPRPTAWSWGFLRPHQGKQLSRHKQHLVVGFITVSLKKFSSLRSGELGDLKVALFFYSLSRRPKGRAIFCSVKCSFA